MQKLLITIFILFLIQPLTFSAETITSNADLTLFSVKNKYGLQDKDKKIIVPAKYKKLIRLGDTAWIIQDKNKFGIINCNGKILVKPKYSHVERIFSKYVKLGNENDFGLYDETGKAIIPPQFTLIEPMFGHRFLTKKNYKYGIYSDTGKVLLDNEYDFIYMPTPKVMRIQYFGNWYEIESISKQEAIALPDDIVKVKFDDKDFKITNIILNTGVGTGYSVVTATDYLLKIFSSISPAYEATIDDLMLSQGAETVSIFIKLSWIPKFPVVYAKKYVNNLITPNNSPLSDVRNDLKNQIK